MLINEQSMALLGRDSILQAMLMRNSVSFLHHAEREGPKVTTTRNAWFNVIFQNVTVCNFCLKKNILHFSVKREMLILFFVNCERNVLFSVKRDQDPPFTTLFYFVTVVLAKINV